ncbi:MAG TPA: TasA family protein [Nocardioides sp.]|nr:TasA family protein [Nocardioides sp.]
MNTKKILVPLATLAAAGAIAVGSGATFTSTTGNTISAVTAGSLSHSNSKADKAIFSLTNIKPGDTVNGTLTLTNTGSLPAKFSLTELSSVNEFAGANLSLTISDPAAGTTVYDGTFGGLVDGAKSELGTWQPNEAHTYRFSVRLAQSTPDTDQGKTASASFKWDSVQLDGTTTDQ